MKDLLSPHFTPQNVRKAQAANLRETLELEHIWGLEELFFMASHLTCPPPGCVSNLGDKLRHNLQILDK